MNDGWPRERVREAVHRLRIDDPRGAVVSLQVLYAADELGANASRRAADALVCAAAEMLQSLTGRAGDRGEPVMRLADSSGVEVPIDHVDPPLRAVYRALLAEVNHDRIGARFQLDLLFDQNRLADKSTALLHLLLWASGLAEDCDQCQVPVPTWLRPPGTEAASR
ncbi:MAG: hypothetical protein JOZ47_04740 [Kutzneria sp.]|nr:hypothetical protein [Kutzneria sp.]